MPDFKRWNSCHIILPLHIQNYSFSADITGRWNWNRTILRFLHFYFCKIKKYRKGKFFTNFKSIVSSVAIKCKQAAVTWKIRKIKIFWGKLKNLKLNFNLFQSAHSFSLDYTLCSVDMRLKLLTKNLFIQFFLYHI